MKKWIQFFIFTLVCGLLIAFISYKEAEKSHFYTNEANFKSPYPQFKSDKCGFSLNFKKEQDKIIEHNKTHFQSSLIKAPTKAAHSSTLLRTNSGLMALFFAGTREGARDVAIYQSFYNEKSNEWSEPKKILDSAMLSKFNAKFIKKLGNPVAFKDAHNKLHLFVVGVSLGGWATSKIYQFEFDETNKPDTAFSSWGGGIELKFIRELELGVLSNFSHLVRNTPIILENGGFILPIYHELARKYPLLAFFDEKGTLLYTKRINLLKNQLQPSLAWLNQSDCLAFFRNHKAYENTAFLQSCENKANIWQKPIKTNLKNYDSSSVLLSLTIKNEAGELQNELLLVHNDGEKGAVRSKLSLFWLKNKENGEFVKLFTLDNAEEVSYPAVLLDLNALNISYTFDRKMIKMQRVSVLSIQNAIDKAREKQ